MPGEAMTEVLSPVQRAFSKQAEHYDEDDFSNPILQDWRERVYAHLNFFLNPGSKILELNAGTGIDAIHLVKAGHTVHATDYSPGMILKIQEKCRQSGLAERLSVQQCSFESLGEIHGKQFDHIFSNFGGLNCCKDLTIVARQMGALLKKGGFLTWVVMPPVCPWEWIQILKGKKTAFRRLSENGTLAHLEGEFFQTYYYSVSDIQESLGANFTLIRTEGLGALSPPPSSVSFALQNRWLYTFLRRLDQVVCTTFPFNRCADHITVTFQFR
jgi:ubiquinone/menaquinone biosynthesis C-methylase UbiE